ncbi:wD repeat domain [Cichlidogyrus casuarinus]|uniref:WD repeat domain n=1 Tax=Cichlidogyrus casuarinus TaxID=1844966 RepID=A0ABD2QPK4_9PLAT
MIPVKENIDYYGLLQHSFEKVVDYVSSDVDPLLDYLFSKRVITLDQKQRISELPHSRDQAREVISQLLTKSEIGKDEFSQKISSVLPFCGVPDLPRDYLSRDFERKLKDQIANLGSKFQAKAASSRCISVDLCTFDNPSPPIIPPNNAWLLLHGFGGQGKTLSLASCIRKNFNSFLKEFFSAIVWVEVGMQRDIVGLINTINDKMVRVLHRLNETASCASVSKATQLDEAKSNLNNTLAGNLSTSRSLISLIILDNVWDKEVISQLKEIHAAFIVTSRCSDILTKLSAPHTSIQMHELKIEECHALVLRLWPGANQLCEKPDWYHFLNMLRGSPFAVVCACHMLREKTLHQFRHSFMMQSHEVGTLNKLNLMLNWQTLLYESDYPFQTIIEVSINQRVQIILVHSLSLLSALM